MRDVVDLMVEHNCVCTQSHIFFAVARDAICRFQVDFDSTAIPCGKLKHAIRAAQGHTTVVDKQMDDTLAHTRIRCPSDSPICVHVAKSSLSADIL